MADVIDFVKQPSSIDKESNIVDAESIYGVVLKRKGRGLLRLDIIKNKETGQIGIGVFENYVEDDSGHIHFEELITLCNDDDDFVYNKLTGLLKD